MFGYEDQVHHASHDDPTDKRKEESLDPSLLALLRRSQVLDDIGIRGLVVGLDARRQRVIVGRRSQQSVGKRKGHKSSYCENKEREELAL